MNVDFIWFLIHINFSFRTYQNDIFQHSGYKKPTTRITKTALLLPYRWLDFIRCRLQRGAIDFKNSSKFLQYVWELFAILRLFGESQTSPPHSNYNPEHKIIRLLRKNLNTRRYGHWLCTTRKNWPKTKSAAQSIHNKS